MPSISLSPSSLPQHLQILMHRHQQLLNNQQQKYRYRKLLKKNTKECNANLNSFDFEALKIKNKATSNIKWKEWEQRMEAVEIDSADCNRLILDYLMNEGQHDMAMQFAKESETLIVDEKESANCTQIRAKIKECIHSGQMLQSIALLKQFDANFFIHNQEILVLLQKQHLIELIHCGQINDAYKYNSEHLLPKTKKNKKLLRELGQIFACIACQNLKKLPPKQRNLLSLKQRSLLFEKINRILIGESIFYQNMAQMNYYQNFLMNFGIKRQFENGKMCKTKTKIMSYNEKKIGKIKQRHPGFGNDKKKKMDDIGIDNWNKMNKEYRKKIKNYIPFVVDTSKCQRFRLQKLKKNNIIHLKN